MRKYILPIMLLSLCSISLSQDVLIIKAGTEYKGEFVDIKEEKIIFKPEGSIEAQIVPKDIVKSLILFDGTIVIGENTTKRKKKYIEIGDYNRAVGGGLIAMAGGLLLWNNNGTLSSKATIKEAEEFSENIKQRNNLAYTCLLVGGIALMFDENK